MPIHSKIPQDPHRYDDMLDMPHPQSLRHPPMDPLSRAAQFSPFAALTGYDDQVREAARLTDKRIELSESDKDVLDETLRLLAPHLGDSPRPEVRITFFVPDERKAGGAYQTIAGHVKRIDRLARALILYDENGISSGKRIPLDDVLDIELSEAVRRGL